MVMQSMNKGGHPCSGCIIVECISRGGGGGMGLLDRAGYEIARSPVIPYMPPVFPTQLIHTRRTC